MIRGRLVIAPLGLVWALGLASACSPETSTVILGLYVPQGLLDGSSAELRVIDGDAARCNKATGFIDPTSPSGDAVQSFPMKSSGCSSGAKFCAEITIPKDDADHVFEFQARAAGEVRARGCTTVTVDQDPLQVDITAVANLPPPCCNDGVVQFGEQCDSGLPADVDCGGNPVATNTCGAIAGDDVCECDCTAKEILLSEVGDWPIAVPQPGLNNDPHTKYDLALAFSGASGNVANSLRAVYTDVSPTPGSNAPDIDTRLLRGDLRPIETYPLSQALRLPSSCSTVDTQQGPPRQQITPDITRISADKVGVAWADDRTLAANFDVYAVTQNDFGCTDTAPSVVNAAKTSSLAQPAIAGGPNDTALVVWADGGSLRGRVWSASADGTCSNCLPAGADIDLGTLVGGSKPRVAGNASGWVVAYAGTGVDSDVFVRTVSTTGTASAERKVNISDGGPQDQPDVAMQPDGSFAVVWSSGGAIMIQRFDAGGEPLAGDQDGPLSVASPAGIEPSIAASGDIGNFYAAAWATVDGTVWARYIGVGADRFLRNHVNGTLDDFLASHPAIVGSRIHVDVAAGGDGFVAIGWVDDSDTHPGVYVRRMPLPE